MAYIKAVGPSLKPWWMHMQRLSEEPTVQTEIAMHGVLRAAFENSQINVHVSRPVRRGRGRGKPSTTARVGGRLRASGQMNMNTRGTRRKEITGTISYGNGLDYAGFEFNRGNQNPRADWLPHPGHNPFDGLQVYYEAVDRVIGGIFD